MAKQTIYGVIVVGDGPAVAGSIVSARAPGRIPAEVILEG